MNAGMKITHSAVMRKTAKTSNLPVSYLMLKNAAMKKIVTNASGNSVVSHHFMSPKGSDYVAVLLFFCKLAISSSPCKNPTKNLFYQFCIQRLQLRRWTQTKFLAKYCLRFLILPDSRFAVALSDVSFDQQRLDLFIKRIRFLHDL